MRTNLNNEKGMGLLELLVVTGILSVAILGMLQLFIFTSTGAELANNKTRAITEAQAKIVEMREYTFANLEADYDDTSFPLAGLNGNGFIYVTPWNSQLLSVLITISWEDKYGRIIGEDINGDGTLAPAEDVNGNSQADSIVEIYTLIGDW